MARLASQIPDIPRLSLVQWATGELTTGVAGPLGDVFFAGAIAESERSSMTSLPAKNLLIMKKFGILFALIDSPHQDLTSNITGSIKKFTSALTEEALTKVLETEAPSGHTPQHLLLEQLLRHIERELANTNRDLAQLQECSGIILWLQGPVAHVLRLGLGRVRVFGNRVAVKNLTSLQGLGAYAFDTAKSKAVKNIRYQKQVAAARSFALESRFMEAHYTIEDVEENARIVMLISPVWMPEKIDAICRAANDSPGRESACTAAWQSLRLQTNKPVGKIAVIDVKPKDPDVDMIRRDKNRQDGSQTNDTSSAIRQLTKTSKTTLSKTAAAAIMTVATGLTAIVGFQIYKKVKNTAAGKDSTYYRQYYNPGSKETATMQQDSIIKPSPVAIDSGKAAMISSADALLALEPGFITFDKLYRTPVPFYVSASDSLRVGKNILLNMVNQASGMPVQTEWVVRSYAGTGSKRSYWLMLNKPLPAGSYSVQVGYVKSNGDTSFAQTKLAVLPAELQSLKSPIIPRLMIGSEIKLRAKLLEELQHLLKSAAVPLKLKNELSVLVYFDDRKPLQVPYEEPFSAVCVPANAKKIRFDVVWTHSLTKETITLFTSKEYEPQQREPELIAPNFTVQLLSSSQLVNRTVKTPRPITLQLKISNITSNASDVPIDTDPLTCQKTMASVDNLEILSLPRIDFEMSETTLTPRTEADEADGEWTLSQANVRVLDKPTFSDGTFSLVVEVKNLPFKPIMEKRILKGSLVIKAGIKLKNPIAHKEALNTSGSGVIIPVQVEY